MGEHPPTPWGKELKYARCEYERRFLLSGLPAGATTAIAEITDRYLPGTRLRLRRVDYLEPAGRAPVLKLTQKVSGRDGSPGLITNTYLSEAEYELLATLPATVLTKTRHSIPPFGVDVFTGELEGLFMAEIEFETEEEFRAFTPPDFAVRDVTTDIRFTGGRLITLDAAALRDLL